MSSIVLNEREWVENAIHRNELGDKPYVTVSRIASYYHQAGYTPAEIRKRLEEFLLRCNPDDSIVKWSVYLDRAIKTAPKHPLRELDGVTITKAEMKSIGRLRTRMQQRLMFTLLCLAKFWNTSSGNTASWVNCDSKEIFRLANIKVTTKRQSLMINDLWREGYIGYSKIVDNININVKIINDDSEQVLYINSFEDLGNQYMLAVGENYMTCPCCGAIIKRSSNSQKYCKHCAEEVRRQKSKREYYGTVA